ncbi:MAG: hypothetical protein LUE12_03470 [Ruminococcus sp.]|nr:hypothetical protein [Ruminococcus sp.]
MDVQVRFTAHQQNASTGQPLKESILFCIDLMPDNREVFSKTLNIDENFLMKLVSKEGNEKYRDKKLLALSEKLMKPLIKTV